MAISLLFSSQATVGPANVRPSPDVMICNLPRCQKPARADPGTPPSPVSRRGESNWSDTKPTDRRPGARDGKYRETAERRRRPLPDRCGGDKRAMERDDAHAVQLSALRILGGIFGQAHE